MDVVLALLADVNIIVVVAVTVDVDVFVVVVTEEVVVEDVVEVEDVVHTTKKLAEPPSWLLHWAAGTMSSTLEQCAWHVDG